MKSWICHKPSVGIPAKRWWFVSTNFKISTSMTTLWHFSGSYARTGRNIRTYAIAFLEKIPKEDWIEFIGRKFSETGKEISGELCGMITDLMKNHPYYTQQLSQQVWFRTATVASAEVVDEAFSDIIGQLSLLFANIIDTLTPRQINFLLAVADGVTNFSSKEVLIKYQLGHLLISKI